MLHIFVSFCSSFGYCSTSCFGYHLACIAGEAEISEFKAFAGTICICDFCDPRVATGTTTTFAGKASLKVGYLSAFAS
jgi:hypothetical protein